MEPFLWRLEMAFFPWKFSNQAIESIKRESFFYFTSCECFHIRNVPLRHFSLKCSFFGSKCRFSAQPVCASCWYRSKKNDFWILYSLVCPVTHEKCVLKAILLKNIFCSFAPCTEQSFWTKNKIKICPAKWTFNKEKRSTMLYGIERGIQNLLINLHAHMMMMIISQTVYARRFKAAQQCHH